VEPLTDSAVSAAATLNSGELYLTPQVEFSFCLARLRQLSRLEHGSNVTVLEFDLESCPFIITGILHETPERPNEFALYELWKGTRAEFDATQGPKPYRKAYIENVKNLSKK